MSNESSAEAAQKGGEIPPEQTFMKHITEELEQRQEEPGAHHFSQHCAESGGWAKPMEGMTLLARCTGP